MRTDQDGVRDFDGDGGFTVGDADGKGTADGVKGFGAGVQLCAAGQDFELIALGVVKIERPRSGMISAAAQAIR